MQRVRGPGANLYRGIRRSAALAFLFLSGCSSSESPVSPEASEPDAGWPRGETGAASDSGSIGRETEDPRDAEGQRDAEAPREAEGGASELPSLEAIIAEYATWQARSEPQPISAYIFGICRAPTAHEKAYAASEHGQQRYLRDWVNAEAVSGFAADGGARFARGATIVKEKLVPGASGSLELAALGIMTKRAPGFDPLHGDWEYGYWEEAIGIARGSELADHCGGCHAGAQDTDYVFFDLSWLLQ
jgi:hypothetical protein